MRTSLQRTGAWYGESATEFNVWAPLASSVRLVLQEPAQPQQDHLLQEQQHGYWKITLPASPGARYGFSIDGGPVRPDPASFHQPDGVHGLSAVAYRSPVVWTDQHWQGLSLSNAIFYELHTGTFSPSRDFEGVIGRLDYLRRLGINVIELMPLAQFPGSRNWGYDGVYPSAIQHSYGGIDGFCRLVDAAHARDMAVVVDVVYNHLGPEGNYLPHYGPYFTDKYKTPWGSALNFDGPGSDGVRNFFLQNARMWLEDYHVDGLRLDAVHAICDVSAIPFIQQLKELAVDIGKHARCRKIIVAEMDLNDPRYINPPAKGGYGLDGQWNDEFHHALRAFITGETNAYYEDFGQLAHLEKAFRHTYVYDGIYSRHRKRTFGGHADNNPYDQFIVFGQNHDQVGNRARGDRLGAYLNFEQLKLAAAVVLLSPYTPLLFMGEEYGETHPFQFFTEFSDPALMESVRKGRAAEFSGFDDGTPLPDPQADDTFSDSSLAWWQTEEEPGATLLDYYRHLIRLRQTRPALQGRTRDTMIVHPAAGNILAIERKILNDHVFIWFHFGDQPIQLDNITWQHLVKVFDSADPCWRGPGSPAAPEIASGHPFHIAPHSTVVYEKKS